MGLNANKVGGGKPEKKQFAKQPSLDPGVYPARLVRVIDLGLQPQRAYMKEEKAPCQEVMFTYELVDVFMLDENGEEILDKPRWISETLPFYGLYADRAKSTQRIKAFDPDDVYQGEVGKMVDTPVNVTIVQNENKKDPERPYENIANVATMRARDAAKCPALVNPAKVFDLDDPDLEYLESMPEWLREKIKGNLNYKGSKLEALIEGGAGVRERAPEGNGKDGVSDEQQRDSEDPPFDVDEAPY